MSASRILKYPAKLGKFELDLPIARAFVLFGFQGDGFHVWFDTNEEDGRTLVNFKIITTGEVYDDMEWSHHSSIQVGPYVWHLLEGME